VMNTSRSGEVVHILCVLMRSVLQMAVSRAGIWSIQLQASFFFAAAAAGVVVPVFLPFLTLAATGLALLSSSAPGAEEPLTFSAALTNHCNKNAYISNGALFSCISPSLSPPPLNPPSSSSLITRSTTPVSPSRSESRRVDITGPGTTSACLRIEQKVENVIGSVMFSGSSEREGRMWLRRARGFERSRSCSWSNWYWAGSASDCSSSCRLNPVDIAS
jgi:hypothetical protein